MKLIFSHVSRRCGSKNCKASISLSSIIQWNLASLNVCFSSSAQLQSAYDFSGFVMSCDYLIRICLPKHCSKLYKRLKSNLTITILPGVTFTLPDVTVQIGKVHSLERDKNARREY